MAPFPVPDHIPTPQGQNCPTFSPPPLDGSYTVPELFDYNAAHNPAHPLFVYSTGAREGATRTIRYPEAWRMIGRTAAVVHANYRRREGDYRAQEGVRPQGQGPTIGILANLDTVSYFCMIVATMRLGFVPFPISIRNSPAGVAHLLSRTHVLQLYVSPDPAMQRLCADAVALLAAGAGHGEGGGGEGEKGGVQVEVLPVVQFAEIEDAAWDGGEEPQVAFGKLDLDSVACLMHSSGSTSFPKPIYIGHRTFLQWTMLPSFGQVDLCSTVLGVHAVPLFHAMGIVNVIWTVVSGLVMGVFQPSLPPTVPTPERYLAGIKATRSDVLFCVPSFVEAWVRDPENIPAMKALRAIVYSGAPMNKAIGDQLARLGVALFPFYGATEIGCFSMFIPSEVPAVDEWEYFKISPHLEVEMLPQEGADDIFEATIVHTPYFKPNVINGTSRDGRGVYRTSDLVQRHPRDPERWRMYGRADDQLMLSTGEKTNPGPLEAILVHDPHVAAAIMFGRGRIQNGVLIEPKAEFAFDPRDEGRLAEFRNKIWPSVERLNQFAPAHSRLFKEMILVADPQKPFEYTPKGTPRRHVVINAYAPEIEALYAAVRDASQTDLAPPAAWTPRATREFVRAAVEKVLERALGDADDVFQEGCDSLQATYIRNTILHALRQSSRIALHALPANFVYDNPTIAALTAFVLRLFSAGAGADGGADAEAAGAATARTLDALVAKYASGFSSHVAAPGAPGAASVDEVVLVTGTTGRLGAHLLAQLAARPSVRKVFALNRPGAVADARARQRDVFAAWGLDAGVLAGGKVVLLTGDLAQPRLGLGEAYDEVRTSITGIIHNAWRVDFNLSITSFEPLIAGVRNLVDLALASPRPTAPSVLFTSSISVLINQPSPVPELPIADARGVVGLGYGESKWAAESVLLRAAREAGLRANVVRVGQLSGDRARGGWNAKEWVPALLQASQVLGAVPRREEDISWVPVDVAASVLLEMLGSPESVLHLVHPRPVKWSVVSDAASKALGVPTIPYAEWVAKLQAAHRAAAESGAEHDAAERNAGLQLVDFFANKLAGETAVVLGTERAVRAAGSLASAEALGSADVERWIGYWREIGFLAPAVEGAGAAAV